MIYERTILRYFNKIRSLEKRVKKLENCLHEKNGYCHQTDSRSYQLDEHDEICGNDYKEFVADFNVLEQKQ